MTELRDRDLVRLYWPQELRPAFDALFDIDAALGDVVSRASEPALAAIKLAWWRERLEELDSGQVPAEPRLQAAAEQLLPRGIIGADLAELEAGWAEMLTARPNPEVALARGERLFNMAARLLGVHSESLWTAGRLYTAGTLQRRSLRVEGAFVINELRKVPRRLRPLTALAALAKRDMCRSEPEATPARAWVILKHRFTGRI